MNKTNRMLMFAATAEAAIANAGTVAVAKTDANPDQANAGHARALGLMNFALKTAESSVAKGETALLDQMGPSDTFESVTDQDLKDQADAYLEYLRKALTTRREIAALPSNTRASGGATIHDVLLVRYTGKIDRDGRTRTSTKDAAARIAKSWVVKKG